MDDLSPFDKIKKKMNEKRHRAKFLEGYNHAIDKHAYMIEHPALFASSALYGSTATQITLPNNSQSQLLNNGAAVSSATVVSSSSTFNIPYKISFTINTIITGNFNPTIFIRDTINTPSSQGSSTPDASNGNLIMLGILASGGITLQKQTTIPTSSNLSAAAQVALGGNAALIPSSTIFTIEEDSQNSILINIFNGTNWSQKNYYSFVGPFTTGLRNIGLFEWWSSGVGYNTTFTIAPTVSW